MYFEEIEQSQTKLWIINSLLELLERKDYSAITVNMIVDHARLGRRTFYRHFRTKDDTMKYITVLLMNQFAHTLFANYASGMEEVAIAYFQFWKKILMCCCS